jgi:predicted lactoylglutathione lyase
MINLQNEKVLITGGSKGLGRAIVSFNPQFTDGKAACLVIGDNIFAMLLTEPFFKTFTKKDIADASKRTEAIIALDAQKLTAGR